MGLFDFLKKAPSQPKEAAKPGPLLAALIERYKLEPGTPPPEASLMGGWWEQPPNDDLLLAFMPQGKQLRAFLGEPAEITGFYLVRGGAGFALGATSQRKIADFPQIARFSAQLQDFQIYENDEGVSLLFAEGATPETIAADLEVARAILKAVEK